jgi:hypothetical protein
MGQAKPAENDVQTGNVNVHKRETEWSRIEGESGTAAKQTGRDRSGMDI